MDTQWKYSANAGFFGMRRDRFNQYQPARSLEEVFAAVASVPGISGIELKYPSDFADMGLVRELLDQHELTLCAVNVDTKDFAEFSRGALSAVDEKTRRVAIDRLKDAMDIAAELKTPYITTCPLSDGYDYPFEIDYGIAWESFIDSIKSAVAHRDDVTLLLEYQPREPFSRIMLSDVGKLLMVCAEVAAPNLGANLDIGHAFAAGDTPAEAAALLARAGRLHYIHSNDNTGDGGDWDMISGSVHFWHWLELLQTLQSLGYDGWIGADIMPKRSTAAAMYAANIAMIEAMTALLDQMELSQIRGALAEGLDPAATFTALISRLRDDN